MLAANPPAVILPIPMVHLIINCRNVLVLLVAVCLPTNMASARQSESKTDVKQAFERFSKAFIEADASTLDSLLVASYTHTNGRSGNVLGKSQWLGFIESRRIQLDAGSLVISKYEIDELDILVHADAAIISGLAFSSGTQDGESYSSRVRFTNLWVRKGGLWMRAAFHDSPLQLDN